MRQIPLVYESTKTELDGYALGSLPDAISCEVTEGLNGDFYLDMEHASDGLNADLLTVGRIIAAKPNMYDNVQGFRIEEIKKDLSGRMTVAANHVSMDLSRIILFSFGGNITLALTLGYLSSKAHPANAFTFDTDLDSTKRGTCTFLSYKSARDVMLGQENSVASVFGGEWKFDNWKCTLTNRGTSRNMQIAYGKNLTDFTETDALGNYDAVLPFAQRAFDSGTQWWDLTDTTTYPAAPLVYVNGSGPVFGFPRVLLLDLSDRYDDWDNDPPTEATLYAYAQDYISRSTWNSTASFSTGFVDLTKILGESEHIELGDTIYITAEQFGVRSLSARVTSLTYDCLRDMYTTAVIGNRKVTLADTLAKLSRQT